MDDASGDGAWAALPEKGPFEPSSPGDEIGRLRWIARGVLDGLPCFVCILAPDGTLLDANRPSLDEAGLALEQVQGRPFWDCYWWNDDPGLQARIQAAVSQAAQGQASRFDTHRRMTEHLRTTVDFQLAPLFDGQGAVTHLLASSVDISDRKAGEAALHLSERRFRQVVEAAPDGMAMVDGAGRVVLVNTAMENLFGYTRGEMLGQSVEMLMPGRYRAAHGAALHGYMARPETRAMADRRELYARRKDGSEFPVEIGLNPISTGGETKVLATIQDVTARKAYQDLLEKALREKTVLLNEIHHRVKNNLQVISSLLSLQSRASGPEVAAALDESRHRVRAMALIHQLLYERNDFSQMDLAEYLGRLCRLLADLAATTRGRVSVAFSPSASRVSLDLQHAVPCGLLVNELVTNAIKHAFPGERRGTVTVSLTALEDGAYRISVADDGIGLPPGIALGQGSSLGFQLIPMLAEQAGGSLTLERGAGTRFDLCLQRIAKD